MLFPSWREGIHEIDLLIMKGSRPILAFECKSGKQQINQLMIKAFQKMFPKTPLLVVSLHDKINRLLDDGVEILPWEKALQKYINT